ncbi:hypothetical protein [Rhizobium phage RHph_X2_28B]|uniref:hypothetical protein n=1 Tax=Rhizobium phage RHph_X2_28B TaxID=2836086 RepID=UPI0023294CC9|nr:hypothetical protein PP751_gp011 [Rhizobium phage RHph_X2_28B]QWY83463.1 hypothetical protein [Rhizobium phage RHph_X2_28B]QWY83699.1 hypothetical protein [Rhizobium phage RHph_X3_15]
MAYDPTRYTEIQNMEFGDLVHVMISNYQPQDPEVKDIVALQNQEYFWAYEALNQLTKDLKE